MKTTVKTCLFEKKCISPSLPPKSLEHLFGSPLYLISGPLVESLVTVAGAGLRKSEDGLEKGKGEEEGGKVRIRCGGAFGDAMARASRTQTPGGRRRLHGAIGTKPV